MAYTLSCAIKFAIDLKGHIKSSIILVLKVDASYIIDRMLKKIDWKHLSPEESEKIASFNNPFLISPWKKKGSLI